MSRDSTIIVTWLSILADRLQLTLRGRAMCPARAGHSILAVSGALVLLCAPLDSSVAQSLPFPEPPPNTAAQADKQFDMRADEVIRTNACGREHDFPVGSALVPQTDPLPKREQPRYPNQRSWGDPKYS